MTRRHVCASGSAVNEGPRERGSGKYSATHGFRLISLLLLLAGATAGLAQDQAPTPLNVRRLLAKQVSCGANSRCPLGAIHSEIRKMAAASGQFRAESLSAASSGSSVTVLNGASFGSPVAPGAWISIFGVNLADTTREWSAEDFIGNLLPTALSGTSVRIGSQDAAISYVSPTQINALIPPDAPTGQTTVTVNGPAGAVASGTINVDQLAPALFMFSPESQRYVAAVLADGTLAGKQGLFPDNPTLTRPLKVGQYVSLWSTGLGSTNPAVPPGQMFSDPRPMNGSENFSVTIGGRPAQVSWVGAVSPGLYQINVVAPVLPSGDFPVLINYANFASQAGAMITIQGDVALSGLWPSPTSITMQAYTTSDTPAVQPLQLLSSGEDFDFTLQSSATWLTIDKTSGHTPATVQLSVDGRTLAAGTYNAQITVLAPGTESPSTTIAVTVMVSSAPQITVSRTSLSYQLVTGYQSISVPVNVLSGAGNVDFTVSKTGGSWLSVSSAGRTPGVVSISMDSYVSDSPVGVVTGNVRITPAGGGIPRDIAVSLTILAAAAAGGSPQIVALDADDLLWGTSGSTGFYGQNIDGATAVNISPPQGITVDSVKSNSSTRVNMNLAVDATASEGAHTMTVTTARGVSNAFPFNVRRGQPQIRDLGPTVVNPGRFYASLLDSEGGYSVPQFTFGMSGVDLSGVTSIQVDPPDGITALPALGYTSQVQGVMMVADGAPIGTRRLTAVSPAGSSNALTFEVQPPSPNAPVISNLTLDSTDVSQSGWTNYINYSGKFNFQDADGDLTASGSNIFLMADLGDGSEAVTLIVDDGSNFNPTGKTSGTISFSIEKNFAFLYDRLSGTIPMMCMVQDAAGNLSNILRATVSVWEIPVL